MEVVIVLTSNNDNENQMKYLALLRHTYKVTWTADLIGILESGASGSPRIPIRLDFGHITGAIDCTIRLRRKRSRKSS
jgi:hypothetical protein